MGRRGRCSPAYAFEVLVTAGRGQTPIEVDDAFMNHRLRGPGSHVEWLIGHYRLELDAVAADMHAGRAAIGVLVFAGLL
jgi:hypothetical protein